MKKGFFLIFLICATHCLFAQRNPGDSTREFLLIVRYKSGMKVPDADMLKSNTQHWGVFIGELARSGKLVTGLRPAADGRTISGSARTLNNAAYSKNGEEVSSIFVIKAANMDEASSIAQKCPIYEMDGSVEIRSITNTTN
ncbi:MAG TPA: YciI family protein [Puia sp.]|nr:YciI family protein [Puia sp.]